MSQIIDANWDMWLKEATEGKPAYRGTSTGMTMATCMTLDRIGGLAWEKINVHANKHTPKQEIDAMFVDAKQRATTPPNGQKLMQGDKASWAL